MSTFIARVRIRVLLDGVFAFDGWRVGTIVMDFVDGVGICECAVGTAGVAVAVTGVGIGAGAGACDGAVQANSDVDRAGDVVGEG